MRRPGRQADSGCVSLGEDDPKQEQYAEAHRRTDVVVTGHLVHQHTGLGLPHVDDVPELPKGQGEKGDGHGR